MPSTLLARFNGSQTRYSVFQLEIAPTTGTPHYQGYSEFKRPVRIAYMKTLFDTQRLHCEKRHGTRIQARDYCMKEESRADQQGAGPYEYGSWLAGGAGTRNDLAEVYELAKSGASLRDAFEQLPTHMIKHYKAYEKIKSLFTPPIRKGLKVILLLGPTGRGKTRFVWHQHVEDLYVSPVGNKTSQGWFDGYDDHPVALLDDFSGQLPLKFLLRILDIYPVSVPNKGGHVWWNPNLIYITSNERPDMWYQYHNREESEKALMRRLTEKLTIVEDKVLGADMKLHDSSYIWPEGRPILHRQNAVVNEATVLVHDLQNDINGDLVMDDDSMSMSDATDEAEVADSYNLPLC